jgi:hypothetical protein
VYSFLSLIASSKVADSGSIISSLMAALDFIWSGNKVLWTFYSVWWIILGFGTVVYSTLSLKFALLLSFLDFLDLWKVADWTSLIGSFSFEKSFTLIIFYPRLRDLIFFFLLDDCIFDSLMSLIGVLLALCSTLDSQKDDPNLLGVVFVELFLRSLSYFSTDTCFYFSSIISYSFLSFCFTLLFLQLLFTSKDFTFNGDLESSFRSLGVFILLAVIGLLDRSEFLK